MVVVVVVVVVVEEVVVVVWWRWCLCEIAKGVVIVEAVVCTGGRDGHASCAFELDRRQGCSRAQRGW